MKDYKAYLKREALNLLTNLKITSPIIISETELDVLVDGAELERISDCGNPYKIRYKDLEMITTMIWDSKDFWNQLKLLNIRLLFKCKLVFYNRL